jgi:hypothetical protein
MLPPVEEVSDAVVETRSDEATRHADRLAAEPARRACGDAQRRGGQDRDFRMERGRTRRAGRAEHPEPVPAGVREQWVPQSEGTNVLSR